MELILRSNQVVGEMKDIIYKCYRYRADSDTVRFTAGRQCVIMSMTKPAGPDASKSKRAGYLIDRPDRWLFR